jgi:hypothetical protein
MQAMTSLKPKVKCQRDQERKGVIPYGSFEKAQYNIVPDKSFTSRHCLPGAQSDKDWTEDEEGHGAAILSLKSHVKLMPVVLSNSISVGKLRSRQPTIVNMGISTELQKSLDQTR